MVGLEAFLDHILLPFLGLPFKIGFYIMAFAIYAFIHILISLGPGGGGYYLYWLFHRRVERKLEKRRASLSHHDTPLRRARHRIFVIFGLMNGLLIPLVIGFIAIIDHEILSNWVKEDEGRLPTFLLAIIGFISILVMILMRGKMMGVKLTLILITLTALSSMINNTPHHIVQALNIIISSYHDVKTTKSLGYYVFAAMGWLGPGLILFWLHTLFQGPPIGLETQHKRAVMIKHLGIVYYLYPVIMIIFMLYIEVVSGIDHSKIIKAFIPLAIPYLPLIYSLAVGLIYWRSLSPGFIGRLMLSLLPSLGTSAWPFILAFWRL